MFEEQNQSDKSDVVNETITVMSDAIHACRKNSFHTDHIAFGQITHKVLDTQHITIEDYVFTQRHEHLACSGMHGATNAKGTAVSEHAHDRNVSVNNLIETRGIRSVIGRWHVSKSITAGMNN